jgi:hypothetical protein
MKIYIDSDNKCHVFNDGTMREFEVSDFDGKCSKYVEGYYYVPEGESWTCADGHVFRGEMLSPHRDSALLDEFQSQYEEQQQIINEYEAALSEIEAVLGVNAEL